MPKRMGCKRFGEAMDGTDNVIDYDYDYAHAHDNIKLCPQLYLFSRATDLGAMPSAPGWRAIGPHLGRGGRRKKLRLHQPKRVEPQH
jgi:hypothetical protein